MSATETRIQASGVQSLVWDGAELVDWVAGGCRYLLDGTVVPRAVHYAYPFDSAASLPGSSYAAIYAAGHTKALILRDGKVHRELNRSYYQADAYEYPICLFRLRSGREVLAHCPDDYCCLQIEDLATGEVLTKSDVRNPGDVFHSRLIAAPDGGYPTPDIKKALGRTLGVVLFQEQAMQLAILCAGFTPGEADGLRRAMGAWRRTGALADYEPRIIQGMLDRGYTAAFARNAFEQMKGFSSYGFPESHAASFAILVYASCWVKKHYPAEFLCALLNSQPMGFYSPSQLVQDARRHDVVVRPADVLYSDWDCTMEDVHHQPSVRLGLRMVKGLKKESAERIVNARALRRFESAEEVAMLARLEHLDMRQLAAADALRSLSGHRRQQVWDAAALRRPPELLRDAPVDEPELELEAAAEGEEVLWDYRTLGLTLRTHPLELIRGELDQRNFATATDLTCAEHGDYVQYVGLVTLRQAPPTAKGVMFISLEDETGVVQVILWPNVQEEFPKEVYQSRMLAVEGTWQNRGGSFNLIAKRLENLTYMVDDLETKSRDFQ